MRGRAAGLGPVIGCWWATDGVPRGPPPPTGCWASHPKQPVCPVRQPRLWPCGPAALADARADTAYAADGAPVTIHSHTWHAALWWALPLALIGTRLIRWAAPAVAAHLPAGGWLALRDYAVLATVRHPWPVTAASAILGAVSHILWDGCTHPTVDGARVFLPMLAQASPVADLPWWQLSAVASDLLGTVGAVLLARHVGRHRLLVAWHSQPPARRGRPARFWTAVMVVAALGLAMVAAQPAPLMHDRAVRILLVAGLALLAGAAATWRRIVGTPPTS